MITFDDEKNEKKLTEIKHKEAEDLAEILSKKYGISYTDLSVVPVSVEALLMVPEETARKAGLAAFGLTAQNISVGVLTPNNENVAPILEDLKKRKYNVVVFMVTQDSLDNAWQRYSEVSHTEVSEQGVIDVNEEELVELMDNIKSVNDIHSKIEETINKKDIKNISKILEIIIAGALATKASDIHLEPEKEEVRFRLRLDGVLQNIANLDNHIYLLLLSRIKIVSGLKLNIKKQAQDGRFSIRIGSNQIEIRTSVIPGAYAESIVLRVLNPKSVSLELKKLGVDDFLMKILMDEIEKPHGMLLNTGPTGSGKTTTLYSFLSQVNKPGVKIITIEDPIEYRLVGITQTQAKKGYSFADGLRSAMRQDPDIIMVGEIRDQETAKIAVQSSLTGHMVFSTLHTNTAAGAVPRLIDLGADAKILGDAITVVMAQRLIRRLCTHCMQKDEPSAEDLEIIKKIVDSMPKLYKDAVDFEHANFKKAVGCDKCNNTGYSGREGIFEIVLVDAEVSKAILNAPSEADIWEASKHQGLPRMKEHGIVKAIAGITSIEEVKRVVDLKEE